jgi:hypothetical protein
VIKIAAWSLVLPFRICQNQSQGNKEELKLNGMLYFLISASVNVQSVNIKMEKLVFKLRFAPGTSCNVKHS